MRLRQLLILLMLIFCFSVNVFLQSKVKTQKGLHKALFEQMVADGEVKKSECTKTAPEKLIDYRLFDLNGDGQSEAEVRGTEYCICEGGRRCTVRIYRKSGKGYEMIGKFFEVEEVIVLKAKTNGYRNLKIT
jgi:hypothetical protein